MSRRTCVDLYNAPIKLRPEWEVETLNVLRTGSAVARASGEDYPAFDRMDLVGAAAALIWHCAVPMWPIMS